MKSKEAMRIIDKYGIELPIGSAGEIINLIRELQKYKDIFEEIEEFLEPGVKTEIPDEIRGSRHIDIIKYTIKRIKEKYFPETKIKDTAERFLIDKFEQSIKKFLEDLYGVVIFKAKREIEIREEIKERNKKGGISC